MDKLKAKIRHKRHSTVVNPELGLNSFLQKRSTQPALKVDLEFAKFCTAHGDSRVVRRSLPLVTMNTKGRLSVSDVPTGFVPPVRSMVVRSLSSSVSGTEAGVCVIGTALTN